MSLPISWKGLTVPLVFICLFNFLTPPATRAATNILEQPWKLLREHRQTILQLSSDREALGLHQTFEAQQTAHSSIRRKSPMGKKNSRAIPQEIETDITTFWAALATIGFVQKIRARLGAPLVHPASPTNLPSEVQLQWIASKASLEKFKLLIQFQQSLSIWPKARSLVILPDNHYSQFSHFFDQPSSHVETQSWITLFNKEGFKGIQNKLAEYWEQPHQHDSQDLISDSLKQSYIQYFVESKLFPLFHTYFLRQMIHVEAQAYDVASKTWNRIQLWQQEKRTHLAMKRLCGNWKWIIHNHQNHGDHKTTMTFSSPEQSTPSQVQPSTILIHGDTVYLKWIFPQGTQEDSLLLSNKDTRLEGTFRNSLGPHGSISGQRLSSCQD